MIAGGDMPDVIEMPDTWLSLYADQLMPLDEPHRRTGSTARP